MKRLSKINKNKVLVSDGAWGTFLQTKGLEPGGCPELWNVTHRPQVLEIAQSYISAGADIILTNSFGGSTFKLDYYGLADRAVELNQTAAEISREAAGDDHLVLASMGPTGKILMMGEVAEEEMYESFKIQATALAKGGADALLVETMSAIDEATLAIKAGKENTGLDVICTFTFEQTVDGDYKTMMGVTPTHMAQAILEAGADMIGTNCGNGMARMVDIVKELKQAAPDVPVVVHANAGNPILKDGQTVFPETPTETASHVPALIRAGATVIGGCCGTTPEHIRAIAKVVNEYRA